MIVSGQEMLGRFSSDQSKDPSMTSPSGAKAALSRSSKERSASGLPIW